MIRRNDIILKGDQVCVSVGYAAELLGVPEKHVLRFLKFAKLALVVEKRISYMTTYGFDQLLDHYSAGEVVIQENQYIMGDITLEFGKSNAHYTVPRSTEVYELV
jgi:hypothetical protein